MSKSLKELSFVHKLKQSGVIVKLKVMKDEKKCMNLYQDLKLSEKFVFMRRQPAISTNLFI